jgi:predicted CopG family antitoxin
MIGTTIALNDDTKKRLCDLKRGGESYDELLNCILDHVDRDASGEVVVD